MSYLVIRFIKTSTKYDFMITFVYCIIRYYFNIILNLRVYDEDSINTRCTQKVIIYYSYIRRHYIC